MTYKRNLPANFQSVHDSKSEWFEITAGERFSIRVSSEETESAYTMLEVVADHRNGTPMHVHQNEDEHFIILEGTAHFAYGDKTVDAPAGANITVSKGIRHAWCNLSEGALRDVNQPLRAIEPDRDRNLVF